MSISVTGRWARLSRTQPPMKRGRVPSADKAAMTARVPSSAIQDCGGISKTVANIPLNATNIQVDVKFQGVVNSDNYSFNWPSPLGQWLTGRREIEMTGVWPGKTHAIEK